MKKRKRPVISTINRKGAAVDSYQRSLDCAARADVYEAIRQGIDGIAHGRVRPAREVFKEFRRRHGVPR